MGAAVLLNSLNELRKSDEMRGLSSILSLIRDELESYFFCVSMRYEMLRKLHVICLKMEGFHAKIRCNLNDISYLSETQKNNFQFL